MTKYVVVIQLWNYDNTDYITAEYSGKRHDTPEAAILEGMEARHRNFTVFIREVNEND